MSKTGPSGVKKKRESESKCMVKYNGEYIFKCAYNVYFAIVLINRYTYTASNKE